MNIAMVSYAFTALLFFILGLLFNSIKIKNSKDALGKAHEELNKEIEKHQETAKDKKRIQTQLLHTQKLDAIGRLAGGIAHDFNNLLTVILGYSDLIMEEVPVDESVHELASEIKQMAKQATALPRQLLAFSRKQVLQSEVIDINEMLKKMRDFLGRMIREDILFKILFSSKKVFVEVDPGQMEQVMMNLILNACDAMPDGGNLLIEITKLHVNSKNSEFMRNAVFGDFVCISVTDTGIGISRENYDRVFEPFFSTKALENSGLGLSVVYGIVKQHNGWFHLDSEEGQGTMIKVFLPLCKNFRRYEKKFGNENIDEYKGNSERILLVEDDVEMCRFTSRILVRNGYEVCSVSSAEDALFIFTEKNGNFDLVFSDIVLPGKNGLDLVRDLIQKKDLGVILTTGYADQELQEQCLQENFRLLKKPYSIFELLKNIRQMLGFVDIL